MKTTANFLDDLRAKLDLPSDGRLAAYLGIHRQYMSKYRTLGHTFDDTMSMKIADILGIEQTYVVACMHHQRAKQPAEKKLWERMAMQMTGIAATVLVALALPAQDANAVTFTNVQDTNTLYYVKLLPVTLLLYFIGLHKKRFIPRIPN
jgi:predicted transcriptional regulator